MTRLSGMPSEIIVNIARYLHTNDLSSLRLTDKKTEAAIFKPFAREFFSKKQFMITEPSLQALIDISSHPQLGPELKHLIIGLDHYIYPSPNDPGTSDEDKTTEFWAGATAQEAILSNGVAKDMLAHALRQLPNLETVDIRDFSAHSRTRDGGAWSSLGSTTVAQRTDHRLSIRPPQVKVPSYPTIVFAALVAALAQAGSRGVGIEVVIRNPRWGTGASAFALPSYTLDQTLPMLKSMKKLHLSLDMTKNPMTFSDRVETLPGGGPNGANLLWLHSSALQTFLSHATNLTWLRLNFQHHHGSPTLVTPFLNWVALPATVPASCKFAAPLERLDLGRVIVPVATLLALFFRFRDTLQSVSIWDCYLEAQDGDSHNRENVWAAVLKHLATLPRLREVLLGRLRVFYLPTWSDYNVTFAAAGTQMGDTQVTYRGDKAGEWLAKLSYRTQVDWPNEVSEHDSEMDDDDDDDNDDDLDNTDYVDHEADGSGDDSDPSGDSED